MLTTLRIKNLALVADLNLEFHPGYNAITGETGAGKSILIGALNLAIGSRADRTLIRADCDSCAVEAVFDVRSIRSDLGVFCEQNGLEPCADDQLIIKRSFSANGTNRQFINGSPTTLNILAALGETLVDIHGPHDHQSLFHRSKQLEILDAFGGLTDFRERFAKLVRARRGLEEEKSGLVVDERDYAQKIDLLRHQVREIANARLQTDEEGLLEQEYTRASNAAKLLELAQTAKAQLNGEDASIMTMAGQLGRTMQELRRVDPSAACMVSLHEQVVSAIRDLQSDLSHYADHLEVEPTRLQELEERLSLIQSLKRRYGGAIDEILAFGDSSARQLAKLEQRGPELERIKLEIARIEGEMLKAGKELSQKRRELIEKFSKAVDRQLADLGFKQAKFSVEVNTTANLQEFGGPVPLSGLDTVEFQFAPNVGEVSRPLRAIASSGELARVMLALKTVLAEVDRIPVLVFDEIDANVGGETGSAVGEKMCRLGQKRQVLCITHLAPVAARADKHFCVIKEVRNGRTITEIKEMAGREREGEVARMLGGLSSAALRHAAELLRRK